MNTNFKQSDFTVKASTLCKVHGISQATLSKWTQSGAFPYTRLTSNTASRYRFHEETLTYTLGTIKSNIQIGKYREDLFPKVPAPTNELKSNNIDLSIVLEKLDIVCGHWVELERRLVRLESKLHTIAESGGIELLAKHNESSEPVTLGNIRLRSTGVRRNNV